MAEIQHKIIPDEFRHEPKHASTAQENTWLRSKGDGSTEFVPITLGAFPEPTVLATDENISNTADFPLVLDRQYVIMLSKTENGNLNYQNDYIDLRGMSALPTGASTLESIGGRVVWQNGQLSTLDDSWNIFRVVEVE